MAVLQTNEIFKTELTKQQHRLTPEEVKSIQQILYGITVDVATVCEELNIPYMLTGGSALGAVRHKGFIPWDDDIDMVVARKYIDRLLDEIQKRYPDKYYVEAPLRTPGYLSSFIQIHKKGTILKEYLSKSDEESGIKIDIFVAENTFNNPLRRYWHGICSELGLFVLSCYRMHLWRDEFYVLTKGRRKAAAIIRIKSAIGAVFTPHGDFWYRTVQNCLRKCKDDNSRYVAVPSGRMHFFGELKERQLLLKAKPARFEDRMFMIPANTDWYLRYMYGDNYMQLPPESKREQVVIYKLKL